MRVQRFILLTVLLVGWRTTPVEAQWMASPYLHGNFGDVEFRRGGYGGSVGYLGGRLGFELDVDRHQHFFKDKNLGIPNACIPGVVGPCVDEDTDAWIYMANVLAAFRSPRASWRPYASAGVGLIHAWVHGAGQYDGAQNTIALGVSAGTMHWLNDWLGVRAELRYFHALVDENNVAVGYTEDYDFARLALGGALRFRR